MGVPPAEVGIDEQLVRGLLADQHPDLAGPPLRFAAAGWDNELWRLGEDLAVRLPRRALGARIIVGEQRWLPELARRLPVPVPAPLRTGVPGRGYPWPWSVVPWLAGETADRTPLSAAGARALGTALRALHDPAPPEAPHNPYRSIPLAQRTPPLPLLERAGVTVRDLAALGSLWERALAAPPAATAAWIHADVHVLNLLTGPAGGLAGILDWGDVCAGDPAVDLGCRWTSLDPEVRPAFDAAYGPIGPELDARARGWALVFAAIVLDAQAPALVPAARATVHRLLADERASGPWPAA